MKEAFEWYLKGWVSFLQEEIWQRFFPRRVNRKGKNMKVEKHKVH